MGSWDLYMIASSTLVYDCTAAYTAFCAHAMSCANDRELESEENARKKEIFLSATKLIPIRGVLLQ